MSTTRNERMLCIYVPDEQSRHSTRAFHSHPWREARRRFFAPFFAGAQTLRRGVCSSMSPAAGRGILSRILTDATRDVVTTRGQCPHNWMLSESSILTLKVEAQPQLWTWATHVPLPVPVMGGQRQWTGVHYDPRTESAVKQLDYRVRCAVDDSMTARHAAPLRRAVQPECNSRRNSARRS